MQHILSIQIPSAVSKLCSISFRMRSAGRNILVTFREQLTNLTQTKGESESYFLLLSHSIRSELIEHDAGIEIQGHSVHS